MLLLVVGLLFVAAAALLAQKNKSPGSFDSLYNMTTARNILEGRGFQSSMLLQYYVEQDVPSPESFRPPGVPWMMAGLFGVFGASPTLQVYFNLALVLLSVFFLRGALVRAGGGAYANFAAILFIASHHYELISIWNSNFLVLFTCALLYVGADASPRRSLVGIALKMAVITAFGYYCKPTFVLGAVPFAVATCWAKSRDHEGGRSQLVKAVLIYLGALLVLTAPYWLWTLHHFGKPIHSTPIAYRLVSRYRWLPYLPAYNYRIGNPASFAEVLAAIGWKGVLEVEVKTLWSTVSTAIASNPMIMIGAIGFVAVSVFRRRSFNYCIPLLLLIESFFACMYVRMEERYLWPVLPVGLVIVGYAIQGSGIGGNAGRRIGRSRARWFVIAMVVSATALAGAHTLKRARHDAIQMNFDPPGYLEALASIAPDEVILSDNPWRVAWHTGNLTVKIPYGSREGLVRQIEKYEIRYFLEDRFLYEHEFNEGELRRISYNESEFQELKWALYEIQMPKESLKEGRSSLPQTSP